MKSTNLIPGNWYGFTHDHDIFEFESYNENKVFVSQRITVENNYREEDWFNNITKWTFRELNPGELEQRFLEINIPLKTETYEIY